MFTNNVNLLAKVQRRKESANFCSINCQILKIDTSRLFVNILLNWQYQWSPWSSCNLNTQICGNSIQARTRQKLEDSDVKHKRSSMIFVPKLVQLDFEYRK